MSLILLECCKCAAEMSKCCCNIEDATNNQDVEIAKTICCALVLVTAIIVGGSIFWRVIDKIAKGCQERRKYKKDEEDSNRKKNADLLNRTWKQEDDEKKKESDLLDKKLQILKELCYENKERIDAGEEKEKKKYEKVLRSNDSKEVKEYMDAINEALRNQPSNAQTINK